MAAIVPDVLRLARGRGPDRWEPHGHWFHYCVRAKEDQATGPTLTDHDKSGTKRHVMIDRQSIPLALMCSAANVHNVKMLFPTLTKLW